MTPRELAEKIFIECMLMPKVITPNEVQVNIESLIIKNQTDNALEAIERCKQVRRETYEECAKICEEEPMDGCGAEMAIKIRQRVKPDLNY